SNAANQDSITKDKDGHSAEIAGFTADIAGTIAEHVLTLTEGAELFAAAAALATEVGIANPAPAPIIASEGATKLLQGVAILGEVGGLSSTLAGVILQKQSLNDA